MIRKVEYIKPEKAKQDVMDFLRQLVQDTECKVTKDHVNAVRMDDGSVTVQYDIKLEHKGKIVHVHGLTTIHVGYDV